MFFTHTHTRTHERTCTLVAARKEKKQQNIFFVLLFIYILEDLKLIVFIFTLTFDKPDIFSLLPLSSFSLKRENESEFISVYIFSIFEYRNLPNEGSKLTELFTDLFLGQNLL